MESVTVVNSSAMSVTILCHIISWGMAWDKGGLHPFRSTTVLYVDALVLIL